MKNTTSLIIISLTGINMAEGYVQCGANICHGSTAQCCSWDKNECCWLSWYTVWWTWVGAIIFMGVLFSIMICCFRKRHRHASTRHIIVVRPSTRYSYGSIAPYPTNDTYTSIKEPCIEYQQEDEQHYKMKVGQA